MKDPSEIASTIAKYAPLPWGREKRNLRSSAREIADCDLQGIAGSRAVGGAIAGAAIPEGGVWGKGLVGLCNGGWWGCATSVTVMVIM